MSASAASRRELPPSHAIISKGYLRPDGAPVLREVFMFGFRFVKVPPTTHVIQFRSGKIVRSGAGLSFFYFAPNSVLVQVPMASSDVPFVFNEMTADFQDATIQGELTYRISDPKRIATLLDFSVDARGRYRSSDAEKLSDRL